MRKFTRTIENFDCGNCGYKVFGNGYTNHCPNCLWSRHVDVSPGDRSAMCWGMMEPVGIEIKGGEHTVAHRCLVCGETARNKVAKGDNFEVILELASRPLAS